jgi:hypothetical protein
MRQIGCGCAGGSATEHTAGRRDGRACVDGGTPAHAPPCRVLSPPVIPTKPALALLLGYCGTAQAHDDPLLLKVTNPPTQSAPPPNPGTPARTRMKSANVRFLHIAVLASFSNHQHSTLGHAFVPLFHLRYVSTPQHSSATRLRPLRRPLRTLRRPLYRSEVHARTLR